MTAYALAGGAEAQGEVGLIDGRHHVGASVHECVVEVIAGRGNVAGLRTLLVLGVGGDDAQAERVMAGDVLGGLVELCLGSFGFIGLEGTGRNGSHATLELAEGTHTVIEELKGLNELVRGDLREPIVGDKEGVLRVANTANQKLL